MKRVAVFDRFDGGWSTDQKVGIENSFAYSKHIDFRKKPSQMTILPETTAEGDQVIVDLIQNIQMGPDGSLYALGEDGWFYRKLSGTWSSEGKLDDGAFGMSIRSDLEKLFLASTTSVSEYSRLSDSPTIQVNKYGTSRSTSSDALSEGGNRAYTLKTFITEGDRQSFISDIEPLRSLRVKLKTAGTGDWTLTVHDPNDNVLAESTVTNSNLVADGNWQEFEFTDPASLLVKPSGITYHFHLTSTVADGMIFTDEDGVMEEADFELYADRLVTPNNGMHPMQNFIQYVCIGNGRYLSAWEPLSDEPSNSEWERHKLTFPAELEVCGLSTYNEYLAIACEHKASSTTDPQDGYIFFWDGISTTYNYFIRIPEGSPYALHEYKNVLYFFAGGAWYALADGAPQKIRTMPNSDSEFSDATDQTIVYPHMATVRRGIHLLGFPSDTSNTSIEYGVYSYGAADKNFSDSFGYSYTVSSGASTNDTADFKIGTIHNFGDTLYISSTYNGEPVLDVVDNSSDPFSTASWESALIDGEVPSKEKQALQIEVVFEELPSNATVGLKYRTSRTGAWSSTTTASSGTSLRLDLNSRFKEFQIGLDLTAGTETPIITSLMFVFDDLSQELFT